MKHLLLFTIIPLIFSCTSSPSSSQKQEEEKPAADKTPATAAGIILGDGVRIRQDSTLQSPVTGKVSTGEVLDILQLTATKHIVPGDESEGSYPMVRVKTGKGSSGWISGKYVFLLLERHEAVSKIHPVSLGGQEFRLQACRNYGTGASDEVGLTGYAEFYPLLLVDTQTGQPFAVTMFEPAVSVPNVHYWSLENDEGGTDAITGIEAAGPDKLRVSMKKELMEGCIRYQVDIVKKGQGLAGKCVNLRRSEDEGCD